ncbi:hypothetical protein H0H93_011315, partial [Arthromyces matolae]
PQQNSINAPTGALHPKDSTNSENLHVSDLVGQEGSGSEKLNSNLRDPHHDKSSMMRTESRKHIKPKGHWLPPDSRATMPVLDVSLQEAYNNPLEASVEELKGVLEFLDKRRYARMENARTGSKTRYQSERGTVKPATRDYEVKTHHTEIPTITDPLKLQRELAYLVVTNRFYQRTSGKKQMIETLERERQSESGGATTSSPLSAAGTPAAGASDPVPPGLRATRPVLDASLQAAYNNPLKASVDDLKGVLEFLDKRRNTRRVNKRIGSKKYRSESGTAKPATRHYKLKTYRTEIPTITDPLKLQRELAYLVVTHRFYHRTSGKNQMIETLERERQSESGGAAISSTASESQQPNTASSSSHPVTSSTPGSINENIRDHGLGVSTAGTVPATGASDPAPEPSEPVPPMADKGTMPDVITSE